MTKPTIENQSLDLASTLASVIASETTVEVLVILVDKEASPKEIGERLNLPTPRISHHVKKLERLSLIECVEERDAGGVIQHFYRAVVRPIVDDRAWGKLTIDERQRYSIWIVRMLLTDMTASFMSRLFDARSNRHLSRVPLVVDDEGVDEVAEIQNRALDEVMEVEAASAERRLRTGAPAVNLVSGMVCFELPEPSQGLQKPPDLGREGDRSS